MAPAILVCKSTEFHKSRLLVFCYVSPALPNLLIPPVPPLSQTMTGMTNIPVVLSAFLGQHETPHNGAYSRALKDVGTLRFVGLPGIKPKRDLPKKDSNFRVIELKVFRIFGTNSSRLGANTVDFSI